MSKSKLITVLSDKHNIEYNALCDFMVDFGEYQGSKNFIPAINSRMAWLEYQAKLKVESILELCKTGK